MCDNEEKENIIDKVVNDNDYQKKFTPEIQKSIEEKKNTFLKTEIINK